MAWRDIRQATLPWLAGEAVRRGTVQPESAYPGCHRIRLAGTRYPRPEKAEDWEFSYNHQGVLTHVLNRDVLADSHHAYAWYWSAPAGEQDQSWPIFKVLPQAFRPAAP